MENIPQKNVSFAFFGTPAFVIPVLEELKASGYLPSLIVTAPDKPVGRKHELTPPPVKTWGIHEGIPILQPEKLRNPEQTARLKDMQWDFFIVAGYGKILPPDILALPKRGTLNVHPSLLPLHRGPAPVESQIIEGDEQVGVSIIELDAEMDHGPIAAQHSFPMPDPLPRAPELDDLLWPEGGKLLVSILPEWMAGRVVPREQDHSLATFTKKLTKEDGLIDLDDDPLINFRKIRAYDPWPGTYFFINHESRRIRIIIKEAELADGKLILKRIVPEGKKEMNYEDFIRNV